MKTFSRLFTLKKKSEEEGGIMTLVVVIVALVGITLLLIFLVNLREKAKAQQEETFCKNNVENHAQLLEADKFLTQLSRDFITPIECPTHMVTIKDKTPAKVKYKLANEMRRCWNIWLEGKQELFKEKEGTFCHVCSYITFTDKTKKITGFAEYLNSMNVPGKEISYADYLNGYTSSYYEQYLKDNPVAQERSALATIDTSKDYGVIFAYAKGGDNAEIFINDILDSGRLKFATGGAGGVALGGAVVLGAIFAPISVPAIVVIGGVVAVVGGAVVTYEALFSDVDPEWVSGVYFVEYDAQAIQDLGCVQSATGRDDTLK
jgi:hypothetical protein